MICILSPPHKCNVAHNKYNYYRLDNNLKNISCNKLYWGKQNIKIGKISISLQKENIDYLSIEYSLTYFGSEGIHSHKKDNFH